MIGVRSFGSGREQLISFLKAYFILKNPFFPEENTAVLFSTMNVPFSMRRLSAPFFYRKNEARKTISDFFWQML